MMIATKKHIPLVLSMLTSSYITADAANIRLRGVADVDSSIIVSESKKKRITADGFNNSCLKGRFSYSNVAADTASISVGVFDGNGSLTYFDDLLINHPDGEGGRIETTLSFNYGTYEISPNGRGKIYASVGDEGGPYYDPPAQYEFVVSGTADDCEIISIDSFLVSHVGVASQLVAPHWSKIADM